MRGFISILVSAIIVFSILYLVRSDNPTNKIVEDGAVSTEVTENVEVLRPDPIVAKSDVPVEEEPEMTEEKRYELDGIEYTVRPEEIRIGCPGLDCIPSIDDPTFVSVSDKVSDDTVGVGVSIDGDSRFYPYSMLVQREIVNDWFGSKPVLVTYCPLCGTAVVFNREVNGVATEFGVSGLLWESNLIMYNRASGESRDLDLTEQSLWSQVLGKAIGGKNVGDSLEIIPSDTVIFGDWKSAYPSTKVLDDRVSFIDPYGDYYTNRDIYFGASFDSSSSELHPKEFVIGVEVDGVYKAYVKSSLPVGSKEDTISGKVIEISKDGNELVVVRDKATGEVVRTVSGFWFSWVAAHPETLLMK